VFILLVGYCRIRCGLRIVGCRFCCCHMAAGFRFGLFDWYRHSPSFLLPRPISCQTVAAEGVRSSFVGLYVSWVSTSPAVSFRRGRGGLRQSTTGRQAAGRPRPLSDGRTSTDMTGDGPPKGHCALSAAPIINPLSRPRPAVCHAGYSALLPETSRRRG